MLDFVKKKLGGIAGRSLTNNTVDGKNLWQMVGFCMPLGLTNGIRIGIEHQSAEFASLRQMCQPTGEVTDIAAKIGKCGEIIRQHIGIV